MAGSQDGGQFGRPAKLAGDSSGEYLPLRVDAGGYLLTTTAGGGASTTADVTDRPARLLGHVTVDNPTANPETGLAKDGSDITAPTAMPAGGVGIRGWLSAIWTKLNGSLAVTGPVTNAELRASAVPVSNATLPLPAGAATSAAQTDGSAKTQVTLDPADLVTTGSITAAGQTVALALTGGQSSWSVQATGTFVATLVTEVTIDGATWVPVNSRQSNGGRLANNFSSPGVFRGSAGGVAQMRVRCSSYTSGTVTLTVRIGGVGAIFSNSTLVTQGQSEYYASSAGLNSMYQASSDTVTFGVAPTDLAFFAIYNPAGAGNPLYVDRITIGAGGASAGLFRRKRFTGVPTGGASAAWDNRAGSANTPNAIAVKSATGLTLPGTPILQKANNVAANAQDTVEEEFSLIVPTGQGLAFTYTGGTNSVVTCGLIWSEGSSLT